jgi:REP element-mobilizing transposase RayT
MRSSRAKVEGHAYYHVTNRILERRYILQDGVAEQFRLLMRKVEAFTGVRVVTYCLMTNHVHLLLEVPNRSALTDKELLARLKIISSPTVFMRFQQQWNRMVEQKSESGVEQLRQSVRKRMFDVSFFMKELKQRFSFWYNRKRRRQGPVWEDRFKSTLVQGQGTYLATAAAYIDLNPVRAGIVEDPKDFRFCGYAEALAGNTTARKGLEVVTSAYGITDKTAFRGTDAVLARYRQLLFGKATTTTKRKGVTPEAAQQTHEDKGELAPWEIARHRLRWLADGAVIGSKEFVGEMRAALREKLGLKRDQGAFPAEECPAACSLRSLRHQP